MKVAVVFICLLVVSVAYGEGNDVDRIINGDPAQRGDYPWLVAVIWRGDNWCQGTILDNKTVLITAGCAMSFTKEDIKTNQVKVRAGDHLLQRKDPYERNVDVKRVIIHPEYDGGLEKFHMDVAILKLRCELQFNDFVKAIPRVPGIWKEKQLIDINDCSIAGFGATRYPRQKYPWQLQTGAVSVKPRWYCAWRLRDTIPELPFNKYQICTDDVVSLCNDDNGAGLICKDGNDDPFLLGIGSFGKSCNNGLNVYVRLTEFNDWIDMYM